MSSKQSQSCEPQGSLIIHWNAESESCSERQFAWSSWYETIYDRSRRFFCRCLLCNGISSMGSGWLHDLCGLLLRSVSNVSRLPRPSAPAATGQRWRQSLFVFRELSSAPPLPQPPTTHAHPAHTSIWPTEKSREVCWLVFTSVIISKTR